MTLMCAGQYPPFDIGGLGLSNTIGSICSGMTSKLKLSSCRLDHLTACCQLQLYTTLTELLSCTSLPLYTQLPLLPFVCRGEGGAGPSKRITNEALVEADCDWIILCPCGFTIEDTKKEEDLLSTKPWWYTPFSYLVLSMCGVMWMAPSMQRCMTALVQD